MPHLTKFPDMIHVYLREFTENCPQVCPTFSKKAGTVNTSNIFIRAVMFINLCNPEYSVCC